MEFPLPLPVCGYATWERGTQQAQMYKDTKFPLKKEKMNTEGKNVGPRSGTQFTAAATKKGLEYW